MSNRSVEMEDHEFKFLDEGGHSPPKHNIKKNLNNKNKKRQAQSNRAASSDVRALHPGGNNSIPKLKKAKKSENKHAYTDSSINSFSSLAGLHPAAVQ